jgi:hypothetical protein
VAVLGAAGGIGQPLSLLLKMNPLVSTLALYDIANTPGVAADLSHCNTPAQARARGAVRRNRRPKRASGDAPASKPSVCCNCHGAFSANPLLRVQRQPPTWLPAHASLPRRALPRHAGDRLRGRGQPGRGAGWR